MNSTRNLIFQSSNIGLGKRKKSIARVFLVPGTGNLTINQQPGEQYLQFNDTFINKIKVPLQKLDLDTQFDIIVIVKGGGLSGQADAIQLGVARLLCNIENSYRTVLKPFGVLTRDARIKERKKYGLRKARKAPQYSKR